MTFSSSLAFFDHLMNEGALDEAAFVEFLKARASNEGLHLDIKSGLELDKPKDKRNFTLYLLPEDGIPTVFEITVPVANGRIGDMRVDGVARARAGFFPHRGAW